MSLSLFEHLITLADLVAVQPFELIRHPAAASTIVCSTAGLPKEIGLSLHAQMEGGGELRVTGGPSGMIRSACRLLLQQPHKPIASEQLQEIQPIATWRDE
ncbi:MAG: hypothetical protein P8Z78_15110 [Gammaproteobacteria bacterium]|jgi:hypothetical protein